MLFIGKLFFNNKLTCNFWGFDLQIVTKYSLLPHFHYVSLYIALAYLQNGLNSHREKTFIGRKIILILCYFEHFHASAHFFRLHSIIDCFSASSIGWTFLATFSWVRLGSCSKWKCKRLDEHLLMDWSQILVDWLIKSPGTFMKFCAKVYWLLIRPLNGLTK